MEQKTRLLVGDKYLSIKMAGHDYVVAFKNQDYGKGRNRPLFKGDGVAVWVKTKKEKKDEIEELEEEMI